MARGWSVVQVIAGWVALALIPSSHDGCDYDAVMLHDSPLRSIHEQYVRDVAASHGPARQANRPGAAVGQRVASALEWLPYGVTEQTPEPHCDVVASFGDVEPEYAAIRRGAGIMDCPHRGTLIVSGKDRREFLNRMLTQELKDLSPGVAKESFWLNRKGRIEADLLLVELDDRIVIDLDICQAAVAARTLQEFVFTEEVEVKDCSSSYLHVAVLGPMAQDALGSVLGQSAFNLEPLHGARFCLRDQIQITIIRRDTTGEPGFGLIVPINHAPTVWNTLIAAGHSSGESRRRIRPIGWHAFNIARIEAGTPLMNIDFGAKNLPHETGVLGQRVSFTKGCYLGQEIVARMESLGQPKQILVGLRMVEDCLPVAGAQVFAIRDDGLMDQQIGAVTSSTLSPMLGAEPIAFAMLRTSLAPIGAKVLVNAEGGQSVATVTPLQLVNSGSGARHR